MDELLTALTDRLAEFGLRMDTRRRPAADPGHDMQVRLSRGAAGQDFAMEFARRATLTGRGVAAAKESLPVLVGAASVSARTADAFRRADVQYVDAAGNAWIHFGDVLIDVRGRRPERRAFDTAPERGGNLFSTARAQVAFALLQWPASWRKPQRDVAAAAGVSLGQANDALRMFRAAGFGPGGHRSDAELLDLWVASFPSGLGRKLLLATYRGSVEHLSKVGATDPVFVAGASLSGELAADDLLRPAALVLYVAELDPMLPVRNRWRSDGDANIAVRRKFWTTPPDETQDYDRALVGVRMAPDRLVYADLASSDNPRVRSVASEWRRTRLAGRGQGR
jgi:hypothetical protein